jgi:hypothetical protein
VLKVGESWPSGGISIEGNVSTREAAWNGFARGEALQDWLKNGWKEGTLEVESFTEKGHHFSLPPGKRIKIIVLQKEKDFFNIVTRPAYGKKDDKDSFTAGKKDSPSESEIHGRWPRLE